MSQERLSALFDGECPAGELDRLLEDLERSPELKASYSRLCMAREAAEGTRILKGQPCLSGAVMARLAAEPMADFSPRVADLDARRPRRFSFKPAYGLAAAASMAAVAVLVAMPGLKPEGGQSAYDLVPEVSAPAGLSPVSLPGLHRPGLRSVSLTSEQAQELNDLLLEHSTSTSQQGMGGTLRYARVAAHPTPAVYRPEGGEQR